MDTFDFEKYDVIGFVQKPGLNKGHSTITVMGIVDRISNIYIPLSNSERLALFRQKVVFSLMVCIQNTLTGLENVSG